VCIFDFDFTTLKFDFKCAILFNHKIDNAQGALGLHRTGHGGVSRDANCNAAINYLVKFLKDVELMAEDSDEDFETWFANLDDRESKYQLLNSWQLGFVTMHDRRMVNHLC
jgi:hypothetical protein